MLEIARSKLRTSFTGIHLPIKEADFLSVIPNIDFDLIWMSDVLMFYFYPPDAGDPLLDPSGVLRTLVKLPNARWQNRYNATARIFLVITMAR